MPLDPSLTTDLHAILTVLSEKRAAFIKYGAERATQLQALAGDLRRIAGAIEKEAHYAQLAVEAQGSAPGAKSLLSAS
jgi:hypothetical protein